MKTITDIKTLVGENRVEDALQKLNIKWIIFAKVH